MMKRALPFTLLPALLHKAILRRVTPNPRRSYATATV